MSLLSIYYALMIKFSKVKSPFSKATIVLYLVSFDILLIYVSTEKSKILTILLVY